MQMKHAFEVNTNKQLKIGGQDMRHDVKKYPVLYHGFRDRWVVVLQNLN